MAENTVATGVAASASTTAPGKDVKKSSRPRPFKCQECASSFMQKAHLMLHVKRRHRPRNDWFVCQQCNKRFVFKSELSTHCDRVHGGPKLFKCTTCHKNYARNWILKQHMSSVHGILNETPRVSKRQRELQRIKFERQQAEDAKQNPSAAATAAPKNANGAFNGTFNGANPASLASATSQHMRPSLNGCVPFESHHSRHPSQSGASSFPLPSPPHQQKSPALSMTDMAVAAISRGDASSLHRALHELQKQQEAHDRHLIATNSHPRQHHNEWLAKQHVNASPGVTHVVSRPHSSSKSQAVDLQQLYNLFAQQNTQPRPDPAVTALGALLKGTPHPSLSPSPPTSADSIASLIAAAATPHKYTPALARPSPMPNASAPPAQQEISAMIAGLNLNGSDAQQLLSVLGSHYANTHATPSSGSSPTDVHRSLHSSQHRHAPSSNNLASLGVKANVSHQDRRVKCDPSNVEDQKMLQAARALTMASRSPPRSNVAKAERNGGLDARDLPLGLGQHTPPGSDIPHADTVQNLHSDEESTAGSTTEDDILKHGGEEFTTLPNLHPPFAQAQQGDVSGSGSGGLDDRAAAIAARAAPPPTSPPPVGDLRATTSSPLFPHHSSSPLTPHLDHLSMLTSDTPVPTGANANASLHNGATANAPPPTASGPRRTARPSPVVPVTTLSTTTTTETTVAHHHAHPAAAHHSSHAHQHAAAAAVHHRQRQQHQQRQVETLRRENDKLLQAQIDLRKKIMDIGRQGGGGGLLRGPLDPSHSLAQQALRNMHLNGESPRVPQTYNDFLFPTPSTPFPTPPPPLVPAAK